MEQLRSKVEMQETGTAAVRKLRVQKLSNGYPFMINSNHLPVGQCYLEYPDGTIKLATLTPSKNDFSILKELSISESSSIRRQFELLT